MSAKKKFSLLLSMLMVVSMLLAACGGAEPTAVPEEPTAEPTMAPEEPTEVPTEEPVEDMGLGAVVIGTNAEYPPFEYVDEAGNIVGFDVDIMMAIAEAAGFEYEFVNTRWDGIFVALASGEFDAVISAATITDERMETVDFSDPYFNAGQMIAVLVGTTDIESPADLDGKRVGVQLGTTGDIWATENTGAEVVRYDEITLAFQALENGDVDAVLNDGPTSADIIKANPELGATLVGEPFTDEFYGIAINKDKTDVKDAINTGLAAIRASGQYQDIYDEWFGVSAEEGDMGEAMMNGYEAPNCDYGGEFLKMEALDDLTVQFTLCAPDVAFPSKVAFSAFAIHPSEYLESTGGGGDLVDNPVGTGPYMMQEWRRGEQIIMTKNPDYWGDAATADTLVFRWSTEGAQRLVELQSGNVDGIDNPSPDDFATIEADSNLTLYPREALNIFYLGMNNWFAPFDDELVRQAVAMGIDRQRIVDNFYPEGSTVASHFTPCAIPGGCDGEEWYEFDVDAAKALLAEAGYPDGFSTYINYRDVFRSYLPEPGLVAQDIQAQLKNNLNIDAEIVVMESGEFIDTADAGELEGFHLLGWGADYPDQTNFLDFHFGAGASDQFGDGFPDIWDALNRAGSLVEQADRNVIYAEANNLLKEHVPMIPVAHGGSAVVYAADVTGGHASPLGNENFSVMDPGGRDTFVWMQNAEPIGLYCADETDGESLRACEQMNESLLAYAVGGTAVQPSLAESYEANEDLTVWTFHLRPDVTFHDGTTLDAADVILSYALQWDAEHPLHVGRDGSFTYWPGLFGPFLNAPES